MNGITHSIVGVVTCACVSTVAMASGNEIFGLTIFPLSMLPLAAPGALEADFEIGNAGKKAHPILARIFTHRGMTHTAIAVFLNIFWAFLVQSSIGENTNVFMRVFIGLIFGWGVGYLSHVFIDMFNGKGTPLAFPIYPRRIHIMKITTAYSKKVPGRKGLKRVGTIQEYGFMIVFCLLLIAQTYFEIKARM